MKPLTVHDDVKLIHAIRLGEIKPKTLVRVGARSNWQRAETVARLQGLFALEKDTPAAAAAPAMAESATMPAGGATPPQPPPDPTPTQDDPEQGGRPAAARPRFGRVPMAGAIAVVLVLVAVGVGAAILAPDPTPPAPPPKPAPRYYAELNLSPRAEPNGAVLDSIVIARGEIVEIIGRPDDAWVRLKTSMPGAGYVQGPALSTAIPPKLTATYRQNALARLPSSTPSSGLPSDHPAWFTLVRDAQVFATPTSATPYPGKLVSGGWVHVIGLVAEGRAEIEISGGGVAYIPQETFDFDGAQQKAEEQRVRLAAAAHRAKVAAAAAAAAAKKAQDEAAADARAAAAALAAEQHRIELAKQEADRQALQQENQRLLDQQEIAQAKSYSGGFSNGPTAEQLRNYRPDNTTDMAGVVELRCVLRPNGYVFKGTCKVRAKRSDLIFGPKAIELAYAIQWKWAGPQPKKSKIATLPKFIWDKPREGRAP